MSFSFVKETDLKQTCLLDIKNGLQQCRRPKASCSFIYDYYISKLVRALL